MPVWRVPRSLQTLKTFRQAFKDSLWKEIEVIRMFCGGMLKKIQNQN